MGRKKEGMQRKVNQFGIQELKLLEDLWEFPMPTISVTR